MKNKFILSFFLFFFNNILEAENIIIESKKITLDKNRNTSIFEEQVKITTQENYLIESDFAEYDRTKGFIKLKGNIKAIDDKRNKVETNYAEYDEKKKIFKSLGNTKITTSEKYILQGEDIIIDNIENSISSNKKSFLVDKDKNKIFLENFEYNKNDNIFKSIGYIKIEDKLDNTYEFSQIYVDTQKNEILGTDIKTYLNDERFKINPKNKPRVFANTVQINNKNTKFDKSVFTLCDYREKDKCPPWTIRAKRMLHDTKKKTIYYDNAVVKVYDIPIFFIPRLSHPDPSVSRRSGFLPPSLSDSKNLGSGFSLPYFWAINDDKNFTLTNKLYLSENPLFLGEYHQAFKNSSFLADFGFTEGYKKSTGKKKAGDKSHFFSKFITNINKENSETTLSLSVQNVSNDKYLKLYKIESNLVDFNFDTLENSLKLSHEDENIFFGLNASLYETLKEDYNDKYEFILPEITIDKNLLSNDKIGNLDLQTNYKVHKYDTNKLTNFLVNDFNWSSNAKNSKSGFKSKFLGNLKNINYETKNVELYKKDTTSEIHAALGHLTEISLQKVNGNNTHFLKPKLLIRYAPGVMRKETSGSRLDPINAFSLNRLNNINNFEKGLNSTIGFDYKISNKNKKDFDFSVAQIINENENKKMAPKTSLDEKLSDLVGSAKYKLNNKIDLGYNFSIDQNYNDFNYNEISTILNFDPIKIDFNYLKENKHIGDQEYFTTKFNVAKSENGLFSFETKRNLVTNSAEFYNLSYEYLNDCLKAGLVYRREFYKDSELEPENSLMFKITLTPFGNINSPAFNQ